MKALTLYQPWATLVAIGAKRIETRSWSTNYRGPLLIHASKQTRFISPKSQNYICDDQPFNDVLTREPGVFPLPLGCLIATCELVSVEQIDEHDWRPSQVGWKRGAHFWEPSEREKAFGDYTVGRYMWFLANVQLLDAPLPVKGSMGLWDFDLSKTVIA